MTSKEPELSLPLSGQPPPKGVLPCDPVLLLGLSSWCSEELHDVMRNDLVYSRTSTWKRSLSALATTSLDDTVHLRILEFLDGKELLMLSSICNGTKVLDDRFVYEDEGVLHRMMLESTFNKRQQRRYRAIVVSDDMLSSSDTVQMFVEMQYQEFGVNVVVMAIHGCSLDFIGRVFGVSWEMTAYARQTFHLTKAGKLVLGEYAFLVQFK